MWKEWDIKNEGKEWNSNVSEEKLAPKTEYDFMSRWANDISNYAPSCSSFDAKFHEYSLSISEKSRKV